LLFRDTSFSALLISDTDWFVSDIGLQAGLFAYICLLLGIAEEKPDRSIFLNSSY
jgi:hypothetical protein